MSSGVEADIALDAAVVLSLGMTRVVGGAAGLAAGGANALAAFAQSKAEARETALREAERYDQAVRTALDHNARIAALADSGRRAVEEHGVPAHVTLPEPLVLSGQPAEELMAWCSATGTALNEAERKISAALGAAVAGQIFAVPADALRSALPLGEHGKATEPPTAREDLAQTLARVLARVLPDASEADQEHITRAAERLAAAQTPGEAESLLTEVRLRVQIANRHTEQARAKAGLLAEEQRARRRAEAERRYVLDTITSAFGELGYEIHSGFETMTAQDGEVLLTRGSWAEHAVRMRIDHEGNAMRPASEGAGGSPPQATLRAAMVRTGVSQNEEERRIDVEREREWCEAFAEARARLAAAGIHSNVRWLIEPGEQQLPIVSEGQQTRTHAKQHERRRERSQ